MVVSVDRFTAVRMYNKVQHYWDKRIEELENEIQFTSGDRKDELEEELQFMRETEMNVVVSKSQNEVQQFRERDLDIEPHRKKMEEEDLKTDFKDEDHPFRLVFLCAKWMTGFDCPSCSTLYLDKPMKNHTLMQAIARTNRRYEGKENGLIVDYVGLLRNLKKALAIYAKGDRSKGTATQEELPVRQKEEMLEKLEQQIQSLKSFSLEQGIDLSEIAHQGEYDIISAIDDARDKLVSDPEVKDEFLTEAKHVRKLFRAMLPDPKVEQHSSICKLVERIEDHVKNLSEPPDINHVKQDVEDLLDDVIDVEPPKVEEPGKPYGEEDRFDLSAIDFETLKERFEQAEHKSSKAERLRAMLERKVQTMVRKNKHREDLLERYEKIVEEYNAGSKNAEKYYEELLEFASELSQEEKRKIREELTEEELAVFDILTKPKPDLEPEEEEEVKKVAEELLETLKDEKLVLDWKKKESTKSAVEVAIEDELVKLPEDKYPKPVFEEKVDKLFNHIYESYNGEGENIYAKAG